MTFKPITSLQNPRVKRAVRLRTARQRTKEGLILIDGAREIQRAIASGIELAEVFVCPSQCHSPESRQLLAEIAQTRAEIWDVPPAILEKLVFGERGDGVLAVAKLPETTLANLVPRGDGPIVVLEGVEKPGNVGAVLRNADGAGIAAVIVADPATDLFNPNCIRASLGTVFTQPVAAADSGETLAWLTARGTRILTARVDGAIDYRAADLTGNVAIVAGSEAHGLSAAWHGQETTAIKLPMLGKADSLNVSAACAVLFYEALRQREYTQRPSRGA